MLLSTIVAKVDGSDYFGMFGKPCSGGLVYIPTSNHGPPGIATVDA